MSDTERGKQASLNTLLQEVQERHAAKDRAHASTKEKEEAAKLKAEVTAWKHARALLRNPLLEIAGGNMKVNRKTKLAVGSHTQETEKCNKETMRVLARLPKHECTKTSPTFVKSG